MASTNQRDRICTVVGAGLSGAAAAWELARQGYDVRVFEREANVGGHCRTEWRDAIPFEPHGPHIFHTTDREVWELVTSLTTFLPYRHRVVTRIGDVVIGWPPQVGELPQLPEWEAIDRELAVLPGRPDCSNFKTYCVSILGPTLYELAVRPYTEKQWGCDPTTLSASIARKRVELRRDGNPELFRDPYQGWPRHGYGSLVGALLEDVQVTCGADVTIADIRDLSPPGSPVVVTAALDDFLCGTEPLCWRGVRLEVEDLPGVSLAQEAMVVNVPDPDVPWTRTIETKWAIPELHDRPGTIIMREYPGAKSKHYPVDDADGANGARQRRLERRLARMARNVFHLAGRLATYRYINMDQAIRQGLDAARQVAASERHPSTTATTQMRRQRCGTPA